MAELPMPHQWPTALQAMQRCLHYQGFVSCVNKSNEVDTRNACLCVWKIEVQMSKTNIKFLLVKIRREKNTFDKTVKKNAQSEMSAVVSALIAVQKSGVSAREKPRKHRMLPLLLRADLCEYYERRYTMSKEYYDSRQSAGLLCCTVPGNKHTQPVSSDVSLSRRA